MKTKSNPKLSKSRMKEHHIDAILAELYAVKRRRYGGFTFIVPEAEMPRFKRMCAWCAKKNAETNRK